PVHRTDPGGTQDLSDLTRWVLDPIGQVRKVRQVVVEEIVNLIPEGHLKGVVRGAANVVQALIDTPTLPFRVAGEITDKIASSVELQTAQTTGSGKKGGLGAAGITAAVAVGEEVPVVLPLAEIVARSRIRDSARDKQWVPLSQTDEGDRYVQVVAPFVLARVFR